METLQNVKKTNSEKNTKKKQQTYSNKWPMSKRTCQKTGKKRRCTRMLNKTRMVKTEKKVKHTQKAKTTTCKTKTN